MMIQNDVRTHVELLFTPLANASATHAMPNLGRLSDTLTALFPGGQDSQAPLGPDKSQFFATACVEVWHRALHSLLISCSLTNVSPLWASVSGYYASHYAVRAFAHVLGHFLLYTHKLSIVIKLDGRGHLCEAKKKDGRTREHQYYWKVVKNSCFASDPLFTANVERDDISDVAHRNRANYADHVSQCPQFHPLSEDELKRRLEQIAAIEVTDPPIPNRRKFPDIESVQIVAYHRIIKFRSFLDEILGGTNRFWNVHRNPSWARDYVDYQVVEAGTMTRLREAL